MGNTQTSNSSNKSLKQIVDFVATNYILTQNFQDMRKLSDMKYCNKLVILTSKVISNKLNDMEIEFLAQRTKDGKDINVMTTDSVKVLNKNDLPNLDVKVETDKRRMCIGIAKYYVKIAHIYAAIVTTIKPNYVYNEVANIALPMAEKPILDKPIANDALNNGPLNKPIPIGGSIPNEEVEIGLPQKQTIPANADVKVKINNICSNRLNALLNNQDYSGENLVIKPNFCKMNLDTSTNKPRYLASEPGIPELMNLYYNKYDYDHGGFKGFKQKSELKSGEIDMQTVYLKDVQNFYKIFTGEKVVPESVTTFSDIPLKAYHLSKGCQANGIYTTAYKGTVKDTLFKTYADHTKEMMKTTEANQNKLLDIIDRIFVFNVNPVSKEREVTVKTGLTEKDLNDIVEETRNIIVNLYIKCEEDFLTGLEIFEAIVENQIKDTTQVQAAELQHIIDEKMGESDLDNFIEPVIDRNNKPDTQKINNIEKNKVIEKEKNKVIEKETVIKKIENNIEKKLEEKIDKIEEKLEDKIYKIEDKIEEKIETTPENIELKIAENPKDLKNEEKKKLIDQQLKYMEKTIKEPYLPSDFLENVKKTLPSYAKGGIRR